MAEQSVIHHYPANHGQPNEFEVPFGTRILSAAFNRDVPSVYVDVPVRAPGGATQTLQVAFYATGEPFDNDGSMEFIGTAQNGPFFWHVYGKVV